MSCSTEEASGKRVAKEGAGRGRVVFEEEEEAADGGEEDGQSGSGRRQQTMSPRTVPSLEELAKEVESHEVEFQPVESHREVAHTRLGSLIMQ